MRKFVFFTEVLINSRDKNGQFITPCKVTLKDGRVGFILSEDKKPFLDYYGIKPEVIKGNQILPPNINE